MGKIICLMGKSATGKDTVFKHLLSNDQLNLQKIVPYTTRPIREKEEPGREYNFVSEEEYEKLKAGGMILEERSYDTVYGLWRYFTVWDKNNLSSEDTYLLIGTLETYISLCEAVGKTNIMPIYIDTDDGTRLERALKRERKQEIPKYTEMCRRFLADAEDFSEEKLSMAGIDIRFMNENLEECIENVTKYILENE